MTDQEAYQERVMMACDMYDTAGQMKSAIKYNNRVGMVDGAIALLEIIQPHMTAEERVELWRRIKINYCGDCGIKLPTGAHCVCKHED